MFFLVDAFTDTPFCGNPAGVCLVDNFEDENYLQRIARYYNWSEIAFVKKLTNNRFHIRWFSPNDEAPLCGHATLAAAHILFSNGIIPIFEKICFEYLDGELFAQTNNTGKITLNFPIKPLKRCENVNFSVRDILGLDNHFEILKDDLIHLVVLNNKSDVRCAKPNFDLIKNIDTRAIAVTAPGETCDPFDFYSRYFAPSVGIYEDPVCGSMHCRLAHYWMERLNKTEFKAFQSSKRSGFLDVRIANDNTVELSGRAKTTCQIYTKF